MIRGFCRNVYLLIFERLVDKSSQFEGMPLLYKGDLNWKHIWFKFSPESFFTTAAHVLLVDSIPEHERFCAADLLVVDVGKNTEC